MMEIDTYLGPVCFVLMLAFFAQSCSLMVTP
jgi:hypothetical protein